MNTHEVFSKFREYLISRKSFEYMMLTTLEQGENSIESARPYRIRHDLLDDIIHDLDQFVKLNETES